MCVMSLTEQLVYLTHKKYQNKLIFWIKKMLLKLEFYRRNLKFKIILINIIKPKSYISNLAI